MSAWDVDAAGGVYRVRSRSAELWHVVTLDPARCDCDGFKYRKRCAHLEVARQYADAERIAGEVFSERFPKKGAAPDPVLASLLDLS